MSVTVRVIASCAERKRSREQAIQLRNISARLGGDRVTRWWRALQRGKRDELHSARQLYQGEHWSIVRDLDRGDLMRMRHPCELWVASAGYGLVSIDAKLHPYAATFATRHEDSVAVTAGDGPQARQENQAWWQALADHAGPDVDTPRSVAALAATRPHDPLVVVGSPSYVMAMERDLLAARQELVHPDNLIIVSSTPPSGCRIEANWVITSARLQPTVGGSLTSLNARIARKIICDNAASGLRASRLRGHLARTIARTPDRQHTIRKPIDDVQVANFIRRELATGPEQTQTRLLKRLRASGLSCEQRRFKRIYQGSR